MKVVGTYSGVVTKLASPPDLSLVTLIEEGTGKTIENTTAVTEKLLERDLKEGDSFKVTVYQSMDGKLLGEIEKV